MKRIECAPHPACLVESMRNVGYSMATAVADIIDNSIAAGSSQVDVFHDCEGSAPNMAIIDNGQGMTRDELLEAMRAGGRGGPLELRSPDDMGRFGLGLKTASFSQGRRLTVVSRKNGSVAAACWDLDEMGDAWSLLLPDEDEIGNIPWIGEMPPTSGTMVVWEKMDRVVDCSLSDSKVKENFLGQVDSVRSHLGLVFHRFLERIPGRVPLVIRMNRLLVDPFDPYFRSYSETQMLETETVSLRDCSVTVKPFIIPHYSKLRADDRRSLQEQGGAAGTQGFYVYRNRRLLAWGDWFRLRRARTEASGLARVMIDIPNELDELWSLDIKKSSVSPPEIVRRELKRIIDRITDRSTRTYTSRGQRLADQRHALWQRNISNREVTYTIAREHPLIASFLETLPEDGRKQFSGIISLLEKNVPLEAIHNDSIGGQLELPRPASPEEATAEHAALVALMRKQGILEEKIAATIAALGMNVTGEQP